MGSRHHFYRSMRRDLSRLADTAFDLVVVGAGIHGACAAWDASLRGLSVAVVDQDDFGAATSANSLRIVHGGLRYLARGDLRRMRESIQERSALLRIAPDLVEPLPVLVATHGSGLRSRIAYRAALVANDLVSVSRNRGLERGRTIPRGRLISPEECLDLFTGFSPGDGLTGGALWYDAQLRHPERLTLSFLRSSASRGMVAANYVRVDSLRVLNGTVEGVLATDLMGGGSLEIRGRAVLVAAGPWTSELVARSTGASRPVSGPTHALGVNIVLGRRLADVGVGVQAQSARDRDPVCGGGRFLFLAPYGTTTLLGTWYSVADRAGARSEVDRGGRMLIQEINEACPGLALAPSDVVRHQWGRLPLKAGIEAGRPDSLAERPRVLDHGRAGGIRRLFSVEGIKYTTARRVAERAVDQVFASFGRKSPPCLTSVTPLDTGGGRDVLSAVREEMAIKLADIVFRRTSLGDPPGPDRAAVERAAHVAGAELGWSAARQAAEVDDVMRQSGVPGPVVEAVG
jgi:glycerol-3-phosphate dehydrogenase